jgi:8-oxo-dGTP pyrophosphatase MutT (NUDIX family)
MSEPVDRRCARILLLDREGRVLLFRGCDPADAEAGEWWFTPGGGRDPGETPQECAARELLEETGLALAPEQLGDVVHERVTEFSFLGGLWRSIEDYFLVRVDSHAVDTSMFSDVEVAAVLGHRWWSPQELAATAERVYPEEILDVLARSS